MNANTSKKQLVLDGHKLAYHPRLLADFLEGKEITPVYAEISPVAHCNHRCIFCNFNYLGHQGSFPKDRMITLVEELARSGVKSVVFAGAGEPTMHPDTMLAIRTARHSGLDVAMSTNGALLKDDMIETIVGNLSWIRFSFSGGTPDNYAQIHRTRASDYELVLKNIRKIKAQKDRTGSPITIGTQFILLPENRDHVVSQAMIMKECGARYFSVKHFYESETNVFRVDGAFRTTEFIENLRRSATELSDDTFSFIVRDESHLERKRKYDRCYGLPFIVYFREDGTVFSCFFHQHDPRTSLGSIVGQSFQALWSSDEKRKAIEYINTTFDKNTCQANCRHHQINNYLWELKHLQPEHVNFI